MAHGSKTILFCRECNGLGQRSGVTCEHCAGSGFRQLLANQEAAGLVDRETADRHRAELRAKYFQPLRKANQEKRIRSERERTARRYAGHRLWIASLKTAVGCQVCGETFSGALDFHHVDPDSKAMKVGSAWGAALPTLFAELQKCVLLCANCHRKEQHRVLDVEQIVRVDFEKVSRTMTILEEAPLRYSGPGRPRKID